jgi:hypothetical protein
VRWWTGAAWTDRLWNPDAAASDGAPLPLAFGGRPSLRVWILIAALLVGLVATVVVGVRNSVATGGAAAEAPAPLRRSAVDAARAAAGCEVVVDGTPLEDRSHLDPQDAPPADVLYPEATRPADSGPHFGTVLPIPSGPSPRPLDERAVLHNMEHGSVVVWFDLAATPGSDVRAMDRWLRDRLALGMVSDAAGAVFVSPTATIGSGKPVALRAWGHGLDCDRFDPVVADAFLIDHWGSHGDAPEARLSPFPEGTLRYADES